MAQARALLFQAAGYTDPNDPDFINALNLTCERLIQSGKWQGMIEQVVFGTATMQGSNLAFITLPPHFVSVLKGRYQCWPGVSVWSQFHEFMECGPGAFNDNNNLGVGCWYQFVDMGDQFSTQKDVTTPGYLWLYSSASDNGKVCRIFGLDALTGEPVYDATTGDLGESIILNSPVVQTTHQFAAVTGFQKPATKNPVTLWVNSSAAGVSPYQISYYQSVETIPQYHRYRTSNVQPLNNNPAITVLCQRRYFPVQAETDFVYPGNLGALQYGLQAYNYERLNRTSDAMVNWKFAEGLMNNQTHSTRGGARVEVDVSLWGDGVGGLQWSN